MHHSLWNKPLKMYSSVGTIFVCGVVFLKSCGVHELCGFLCFKFFYPGLLFSFFCLLSFVMNSDLHAVRFCVNHAFGIVTLMSLSFSSFIFV